MRWDLRGREGEREADRCDARAIAIAVVRQQRNAVDCKGENALCKKAKAHNNLQYHTRQNFIPTSSRLVIATSRCQDRGTAPRGAKTRARVFLGTTQLVFHVHFEGSFGYCSVTPIVDFTHYKESCPTPFTTAQEPSRKFIQLFEDHFTTTPFQPRDSLHSWTELRTKSTHGRNQRTANNPLNSLAQPAIIKATHINPRQQISHVRR